METKSTPLSQGHFRYLSVNEIEDPFAFVSEFCETEAELHYLKRDTIHLLKTAYSYGEEFYAGTSKQYGYCQITLIKVIEIMYVLYCGKIELKPGNIRSYENKYEILNNDERNDIRLFLNDFFSYRDLQDWHELMDDLLIYAYKEGGEGFFNCLDEPFRTIDYLEKLTESIFLVYEINRFRRNFPVASTAAITV